MMKDALWTNTLGANYHEIVHSAIKNVLDHVGDSSRSPPRPARRQIGRL